MKKNPKIISKTMFWKVRAVGKKWHKFIRWQLPTGGNLGAFLSVVTAFSITIDCS